MRIFYSPYELEFVDQSKKSGALIKIVNEKEEEGFADLCPLLNFGDVPIEKQFQLYRDYRTSQLLQNSINMAKYDQKLRALKKNVWSDDGEIANHFLLLSLKQVDESYLNSIKDQGFDTVKCKYKKEDLAILRKIISFDFKVRLDFNSAFHIDEVFNFLNQLSDGEKSQIEFIEDPCPYDYLNWQQLNKEIPLAMDFESDFVHWQQKPPFNYCIFKPARDDQGFLLKQVVKHQFKVVVTSSLDHPVGLAHAMTSALQLKKEYSHLVEEAHGLQTQRVLQNNMYLKEIEADHSHFRVQGTGIGFDELLQREKWIELV